MHQVCAQAGTSPEQISQIIHNTTLATNALIERRGAKTAFITTEGFRDVIEMRTESRFEQYDLNLNLPEPLLPRQGHEFDIQAMFDQRDLAQSDISAQTAAKDYKLSAQAIANIQAAVARGEEIL